MTETTTEQGWVLRTRDHPPMFWTDDGWSSSAVAAEIHTEPRNMQGSDLEYVPISRTVTVEIGEPEP